METRTSKPAARARPARAGIRRSPARSNERSGRGPPAPSRRSTQIAGSDAGVPGLRRRLVARVVPKIEETLDDATIGGRHGQDGVPARRALARPQTGRRGARRLGGRRGTAGDDETSRRASTATASSSTKVGDTTLGAGRDRNRIPAGSDVTFTVSSGTRARTTSATSRCRCGSRRRHEDGHRSKRVRRHRPAGSEVDDPLTGRRQSARRSRSGSPG